MRARGSAALVMASDGTTRAAWPARDLLAGVMPSTSLLSVACSPCDRPRPGPDPTLAGLVRADSALAGPAFAADQGSE
jgi:hypothetical protein